MKYVLVGGIERKLSSAETALLSTPLPDPLQAALRVPHKEGGSNGAKA